MERKHLHKCLYEVFPWECDLLGKENNLRQQDIVGLHLTEAVLPLCQTPGQGQTYFGKAWLLPHHCHLQRVKDKRQFTPPVDTTDDSSEVTTLLPALLDEGHEM